MSTKIVTMKLHKGILLQNIILIRRLNRISACIPKYAALSKAFDSLILWIHTNTTMSVIARVVMFDCKHLASYTRSDN